MAAMPTETKEHGGSSALAKSRKLQEAQEIKKWSNVSFLYAEHMLKTVLPFSLKGFYLVSGRKNTFLTRKQRKLLPGWLLIGVNWGNDELPFNFVQLHDA